MLDKAQIQEILDQDVIPLIRKCNSKKLDFLNWGKQSFTETYDMYVGMLDDISVHSVRGVFPAELIAKRNPYQTEEEFLHTKENYKEITHTVFDEHVSTIQRSFADSGWSIEYPAYTEDDNLKAYLDEGIAKTPLAMSLESWIKNVLPAIKLRDPGGCIGIKPWFIPTTVQDGETVISSERFEPIPYYYDSRRLVSYNELEYFMFLSAEKSTVTFNDKRVKEGLVFDIYDKNVVWKAIQIGKKVDYIFSVEPYYIHERNEIPVTRLKGNPFYHEQELVWASPFLPAVPILDECILDNNNLRAIKDKCVYPIRVMIGDTCDYSETDANGTFLNCEGGWITDGVKNTRYKCPTCHGSGRKNRLGPSGEILINAEAFTKDSELANAGKAMYYVEPGLGTPEFLRTEVDGYLNKALAALKIKNTNTENTQPKAGLTATESQLDMKATHATIRTPREQIFDIYVWLIKWIAAIRYDEDYERPTITVSDSFDLKTEKDYMIEIAAAVEANVPEIVIHQLIRKYMASLNYTESQANQITNLVITADRLLTTPPEEIQMKISSGYVSKWEALLHDSGISLATELVRNDPKLFTKDIKDQVAALVALAKEKLLVIEQGRTTTQPSTLEELRAKIAPVAVN